MLLGMVLSQVFLLKRQGIKAMKFVGFELRVRDFNA